MRRVALFQFEVVFLDYFQAIVALVFASALVWVPRLLRAPRPFEAGPCFDTSVFWLSPFLLRTPPADPDWSHRRNGPLPTPHLVLLLLPSLFFASEGGSPDGAVAFAVRARSGALRVVGARTGAEVRCIVVSHPPKTAVRFILLPGRGGGGVARFVETFLDPCI